MPPHSSDPAARAARLTLALEEGLSVPASGTIAVFRPRAGESLAPLTRERVRIVQGFRPDFDAFARAGWNVVPTSEERFAASLVCLPRARAEARGLIHRAAMRTDGPVIVDGQKTDGIDGLLKDCRKRVDVSGPSIKAHGKIFWFSGPTEVFSDWQLQAQRLSDPDAPGFVTLPGVFSADGVDPGSRLLAQTLPDTLPPRVADLGAGWGYLSAQVLNREGVREVHLIEAEAAALDCARLNIQDARARFFWADATDFKVPERYDAVVANPPFHVGHSGQPALGVAFIRAAAEMLSPSGTIWLVANRHLPYEATLAECFRNVTEIGGDASFKVYRANAPVRNPRHVRPGRHPQPIAERQT